MRNTRIIFIKELRDYFNSPIAYIVLIAFLAISGWFFVAGLFLSNQATINSFLDIAPLILLFIIPASSMRLIAEEEKLGTVEILSTMPLQDWEIITGKYLAAATLLVCGIVCTLIYPISVAIVGPIDWGVVIASYIGLIFIVASFCAIGIFASSLTRSQIAAFIISFVLCFLFFILGKILPVVPTPFVSIIQYLGIDYHFDSIARGVIDSRNIIYFLSMVSFFLSFTFYFYRKAKHRVVSGAAVGVILGIVVVVNFISYRIFTRLDLTHGNIYSLSKASVKMVRNLEDPVLVRAYMTKKLPYPYNIRSEYTRDLLAEYKAESHGKVRVEFIDPTERDKKIEAQRAGIYPLQFTEVKEGEYGIKEGYMGLVILYGDKKEIMPVIENIGNIEYDISSKIRKLTIGFKKNIGFTKGHEEIELHDRLKQKMMEQYNLTEVDIEKETIPGDITGLVILGPKKEFGDTATQRLKEFIDKGGTCAFFIDHVAVDLERFYGRQVRIGLESLLLGYGIEVKDGLVLDYQNQLVGITQQRGFFTIQNFVPYPFFPKVTNFDKSNPIVRELESVVFPFVSPVSGGTPIAWSSKQSWLRKEIRSLHPLQQYVPMPNEEKGPFNLAVTANEPARFIVVGTSKCIEPMYASPSNIALFLNTIDWLAQDEALIAIRSKGVSERPLRNISKGSKKAVRWIDTLVPSIVLIAVGLIRWRRREKRVYEI
ncbi:MAG: Gldg family protein [bacterium]|nr:Gldg family protein [bacterium]